MAAAVSARRRRRGAAAVEFALSLPFIVALFGGVVDLCLYMSRCHVIARAARDGARVGSVTFEGTSPTGALIEDAAVDQAMAILEQTGLECAAECQVLADWHAVDGYQMITVYVEYPFVALVGILPSMNDAVAFEFTMMTQQQ